ncbi:MAG: LysR substrate-binding domain-containing protein, partial [Polaromonas sp.]
TIRLEQTLDYEHVSLPVNSAVQVLLQRAAALQGKAIVHRVIVSNFEAALRVVRANLAISVVPREVAEPYAATYGLRVLPLVEPWARRRFAICFRDEAGLSAAARLLVNHLTEKELPA